MCDSSLVFILIYLKLSIGPLENGAAVRQIDYSDLWMTGKHGFTTQSTEVNSWTALWCVAYVWANSRSISFKQLEELAIV